MRVVKTKLFIISSSRPVPNLDRLRSWRKLSKMGSRFTMPKSFWVYCKVPSFRTPSPWLSFVIRLDLSEKWFSIYGRTDWPLTSRFMFWRLIRKIVEKWWALWWTWELTRVILFSCYRPLEAIAMLLRWSRSSRWEVKKDCSRDGWSKEETRAVNWLVFIMHWLKSPLTMIRILSSFYRRISTMIPRWLEPMLSQEMPTLHS